MKDYIEFFKSAMKSSSVVCCRCSPTQKKIIVRTMKKYDKNVRTAAVGDGGNDVAMKQKVQKADIGIGIVGKDCLQASLASDYSINEFNTIEYFIGEEFLNKNTSTMANFIMHRDLLTAFNKFIFSLIFSFNTFALYNNFLTFGYILFNKDTDKKNVLKFPALNQILLKRR